MRWTSICLAVFLIAASLSAQVKLGEAPTFPFGSPVAMSARVELVQSPAVLFASPVSNACPIGIVAERRSPVSMSTVGTSPVATRTQGIRLRFQHFLTPEIQQVTVVVHGLSQRSRIIPADIRSISDLEETFQLTRAEQATSLTTSYLQPSRVFITQWIELTSVDYTDGSTWHAWRAGQCTVTPNKLILVAGR
jgi:hypothetical protein